VPQTVLGVTVKKHTLTEIGFSEVQCTNEGKDDPLYNGLAGHQMVYQWHKDTFTIPPGAVRLATSEKTENQAFRAGRNAYGIQYHNEISTKRLDTRLHEPSDKQESTDALCSDENERIISERPRYYSRYQEQTREMFENFLRIADLL